MCWQVPVQDCGSEQGWRVLALLWDKTPPREAQEPRPHHWQGCRRLKVSQGESSFLEEVLDCQIFQVKVRAVFEKSFLDCQIFSQVNRMTVWRINVKGEPPPQFSWWKDGGKLLSHQDMINEGFFHNMKIAEENHLQVVRLRRTRSIWLRPKSTKEEQQLSCKYSKPRWNI